MTSRKDDQTDLRDQVIEGEVNEQFLRRVDHKAEIERKRQASKKYRETFDILRDATVLARQLRRLRELRGLTQAEVAALTGTSQQVISRLERPSYRGHSLSMLRRVVAALEGQLVVEIRPEAAT